MSRCPVFYPAGKPEAAQIPISAETAAFLGMNPSSNPTVDEALIAAVLSAGNYCRVNVTVTVGGKAAKAGILINGLKTLTGGSCYTDSAGKVMGLTASATTTVSTGNYVDLPSVNKSVSTPPQGNVSVTLALSAPVNNAVRTYTSNTSVIFSPYVTGVDVCCVGGGGGGGGVLCTSETGMAGSGGGGGGGRLVNRYNVSVSHNDAYALEVGRGGAAGRFSYNESAASSGADGGTSRALGVSAAGGSGGIMGRNSSGSGGAGNGNGGRGNFPGTNSTDGLVFGSSAYGGAGGGGGGGAYRRTDAVQESGGAPYGGHGAAQSGSMVNNATAPSGPGGGGGGACAEYIRLGPYETTFYSGTATAGHQGAVYIRYRVSV